MIVSVEGHVVDGWQNVSSVPYHTPTRTPQ